MPVPTSLHSGGFGSCRSARLNPGEGRGLWLVQVDVPACPAPRGGGPLWPAAKRLMSARHRSERVGAAAPRNDTHAARSTVHSMTHLMLEWGVCGELQAGLSTRLQRLCHVQVA